MLLLNTLLSLHIVRPIVVIVLRLLLRFRILSRYKVSLVPR